MRTLRHKRIPLVVVLLCLGFAASVLEAQDASEPIAEETSDEPDPRGQSLRYGIESEVLGVLEDLREERNSSYNDLLLDILPETRQPAILRAVYRLWDETEFEGGRDAARDELRRVLDDEAFDETVLQASMVYLASRRDRDAVDDLVRLAEHRDSSIAASAVRALGRIGDSGDISLEPLLVRLQDADPVADEDLVAALIVTLGQTRYREAAETLVSIAEDEGASAGHRRFACVAVGQIGRPGDADVIERIYYDADDAMLRSYALAGLAEFQDRDSTDILIGALKRDSFWRIRVTAAEKLVDANNDEVSELLRYKAANDPVDQVRIAALKSLGSGASRADRRFLLDYYGDDGRSPETRIACLEVLLENQISGTPEAILEVMNELWDGDRTRFLEYTLRSLSRAEWSALAPVFERALTHDNWLYRVYAIRGIRRSGISTLEPRIREFDVEGADPRVRREAARTD